jgi:hypothetical protein
MQQRLEPLELPGIVEDDLRDPGAVGAVFADRLGAEAGGELPRDFGVTSEQPVDDLVARDRGRTMACERLERRALPGADRPGDRD